MATNVFISWSGELSRKLGEAIRRWLPSTLQFVRPYFTPKDVEKGTKWASEISGELETFNVGIICLTPDNLHSDWVLFEAGALSKNIERSRVCTVLFNLEPTDVTGPLTLFQHTQFTSKDDFKRLIETINDAETESKLEEAVLSDVFEMWWPKLEGQVGKVLAEHRDTGKGEERSDRELLEEILELTRMRVQQHNSRISTGRYDPLGRVPSFDLSRLSDNEFDCLVSHIMSDDHLRRVFLSKGAFNKVYLRHLPSAPPSPSASPSPSVSSSSSSSHALDESEEDT